MSIFKLGFLMVTGVLVACSSNNSESVLNSSSVKLNTNNQQQIAQPTPYHAYIDPVTGEFISSPASSVNSDATSVAPINNN